MHLVFVLAAALSALAPQPTPAPQKTSAALAREARAAYDAGDKAGFLRLTKRSPRVGRATSTCSTTWRAARRSTARRTRR